MGSVEIPLAVTVCLVSTLMVLFALTASHKGLAGVPKCLTSTQGLSCSEMIQSLCCANV